MLPWRWEGSLPCPHHFLKCIWSAQCRSFCFLGTHISEGAPGLMISICLVMCWTCFILWVQSIQSSIQTIFFSLHWLPPKWSTWKSASPQIPSSEDSCQCLALLLHHGGWQWASHAIRAQIKCSRSLAVRYNIVSSALLTSKWSDHNYSWWQVAGLHHILTLAFSHFFYSCQCARSNTCLSSQSDRS